MAPPCWTSSSPLDLRLLSDEGLSSIIWKFDALHSAAQAGPLLPSEILSLRELPATSSPSGIKSHQRQGKAPKEQATPESSRSRARLQHAGILRVLGAQPQDPWP